MARESSLDADRDRLLQPERERRALREVDLVSTRREYRGGARTAADRGADRRAFLAADDGADNRAAGRAAADLDGVLLLRRLRGTFDGCGLDFVALLRAARC